jgi:alkylation response protein AidB-like acyl-CoA dehydrogenase
VFLDNVFVPDADLLGTVGEGWRQVTSELALERSGPERVLSTFPLLARWVDALRSGAVPDDAHARQVLGALTGRLVVLRQMSLAVAGELARGNAPEVEAALVKDLGTLYEGEVADAVRRATPALEPGHPLTSMIATAVLHAPGFTLRGGTNEILRGVVARGLGVR